MTRTELIELRDEVLAVLDDPEVLDKRAEMQTLFADYVVCADEPALEPPEENGLTPVELLFTALQEHGRVTDARVLSREAQSALLQDLWSLARYA